ncbi:LURP-one-related/scramblase family protein [Halorussus salinisoli]|uniref:LURP-one-related/scramblase family protein n=1 Tax=Halorussus salinisoli TaxID=2558242 RepID=UPI0010C20682|nr:hypothetical protein [Halorussus salinisoli]
MADDAIAALDLTDDEYRVVQSLIRNKYEAFDGDGNVVLRGKQKMFKLKEEFPFVDADGNPVFTVEASGVLDFAGDYALVDDRTGETVVVLDRNFTLLADRWTLRDPDTGNPIAEIASKSKVVSLLRHVHAVFSLIPHEYEITDADGRHVGTIDGRFSLKDTYDVTIDDATGVPKEAVVAAAMVVDAIEEN